MNIPITNEIGIAIAVVCIVVAAFVIRSVVRQRSKLKAIIAEFMEAGAASNIEAAYACCSHYSPTKEDIVELIERSYDVFRDYERFTISEQQYHSGEGITEAYVGGAIIYTRRDGAIIYTRRREQAFKCSLMKENGVWKIAGVQIGSIKKGVVGKIDVCSGEGRGDSGRKIDV